MVQTFALLMPLRELKTFFAPEPLNLFVIDCPSLDAQQLCNFAIPITLILFGKPDHRQPSGFIILWGDLVPQRAPRHPHDPTGAPLRSCQPLSRMDDGLTKLVYRQVFGFK